MHACHPIMSVLNLYPSEIKKESDHKPRLLWTDCGAEAGLAACTYAYLSGRASNNHVGWRGMEWRGFTGEIDKEAASGFCSHMNPHRQYLVCCGDETISNYVSSPLAGYSSIIKNENKLHWTSCEIEYFVETHLCKLFVILRSRVLRVVCPH